jgi:hypothetical protein
MIKRKMLIPNDRIKCASKSCWSDFSDKFRAASHFKRFHSNDRAQKASQDYLRQGKAEIEANIVSLLTLSNVLDKLYIPLLRDVMATYQIYFVDIDALISQVKSIASVLQSPSDCEIYERRSERLISLMSPL